MSKRANIKSASKNHEFFDNRILKVDDVAVILGFSKAHVYRLVSQKKLPAYKKGITLFFMSKEIFEWVQKGAA